MRHDGFEQTRSDALDALLAAALPDAPPEDVAEAVTPWRRASGRLLWGLGLCTFTLNFWNLNYLLPFAGGVLMLLALRALRRENGAFSAMFGLQLLRMAVQAAVLVLSGTRAGADALSGAFGTILSACGAAFVLVQMGFLRFALCAVWRKAGLEGRPKGAAGLIAWYAIVCALALLGYGGWILVIALIAAYGFLIHSLVRVSRALDAAGYAVRTAPVRVPDWALAAMLTGAVLAGIACGLAFGQRYKIDWTPAAAVSMESEREALAALGFPASALADLPDDEIALCAGADRVEVEEEQLALGDGRREYRSATDQLETVYDEYELCAVAVAVHLPREHDAWRVYHFFRYADDLAAPGSECIQFRPALSEGWAVSPDSVTGGLLCQTDGRTMRADFASSGWRSYTHGAIFWDEQTESAYFAEFSLPRGAKNRRAWVAATLGVAEPGYIIDSWVIVTHQRASILYPVRSAFSAQTTEGWSSSGPFPTVMDAMQFYPYDD